MIGVLELAVKSRPEPEAGRGGFQRDEGVAQRQSERLERDSTDPRPLPDDTVGVLFHEDDPTVKSIEFVDDGWAAW